MLRVIFVVLLISWVRQSISLVSTYALGMNRMRIAISDSAHVCPFTCKRDYHVALIRGMTDVIVICSRLEAAIGPCSPPLSASCGASHGNEVAAAAEAISSLRLHYEEIVVRLFSCQSNTNSILRDPTKSLAHLWGVVRRDLADARLSTGPLNYDHELWQKAEHLVKCNANDDQREADLNPGASSSENLSGAAQIVRCPSLCLDSWRYCLSHGVRGCVFAPNFTLLAALPTDVQKILVTWRREWVGFPWQLREEKAHAYLRAEAVTRVLSVLCKVNPTRSPGLQTSLLGCPPQAAAGLKEMLALLPP